MGRRDKSSEPLRGLHVLVVDDDAATRGLISAILAQGGALVTEAASAAAAWLRLSWVMPEVIVCALNLGGGREAFDFLRRVRARSVRPGRHVPVVAIVRDISPGNDILVAGFAGSITAPFDPGELCGLLADVADAHARDGDL